MPAQAASAASAPQTIASQPIPIEITATKPLTIEIAKVPDGRPFDPHWTTYLSSIATPIVAVIAAVIAATIQYRQWQTANAAAQTAKNKLKLDLFEKRFAVYIAATKLLTAFKTDLLVTEHEAEQLLDSLSGIDFLFNPDVVKWHDELKEKVAYRVKWKFELSDKALIYDEDKRNTLKAAYDKSLKWFSAQQKVLDDKIGGYLRLSH